MLGLGRSDRGDLGRPQGIGLYGNPAARSSRRTKWRGRFFGEARRSRQPQRSADAMVRCERAEPRQRARPQGAGRGGMGRRVISRARLCAGKMDSQS